MRSDEGGGGDRPGVAHASGGEPASRVGLLPAASECVEGLVAGEQDQGALVVGVVEAGGAFRGDDGDAIPRSWHIAELEDAGESVRLAAARPT